MNLSRQHQSIEEKLNLILSRITSEDLLSNNRLGGDIGFHVFDYPAEKEDMVRDFVTTVVEPNLSKHQRPIRFKTINLFELIVQILKERNLLDKVIDIQKNKGNDAALPGLKSVLKEDKIASYLSKMLDIGSLDLVLLTGIGAAYPIVRLHALLNALHAKMQDTPLVVFYPGKYDGVSLRLFGLHTERNDANAPYYRAFQLLK